METGREMVNMNFGVAERGPRECMGKKIPTIPNGKYTCSENRKQCGTGVLNYHLRIFRLSQKLEQFW